MLNVYVRLIRTVSLNSSHVSFYTVDLAARMPLTFRFPSHFGINTWSLFFHGG